MSCVDDAVRLAEELLDAGLAPWIGSVRDLVIQDGLEFHGALIPQKLLGTGSPTWNVHYVCCAGGRAYDPLLDEPVAINDFAMTVFGKHLEVREVLSPERVVELRREGLLRSHLLSLRLARRSACSRFE